MKIIEEKNFILIEADCNCFRINQNEATIILDREELIKLENSISKILLGNSYYW